MVPASRFELLTLACEATALSQAGVNPYDVELSRRTQSLFTDNSLPNTLASYSKGLAYAHGLRTNDPLRSRKAGHAGDAILWAGALGSLSLGPAISRQS